MKNCYICGKECFDYDTVIESIYLDTKGKFDAVSICRDCYNDLNISRMKNDVEFIKRQRQKISITDINKECNFSVGDNVYVIATIPISPAHPYVFNSRVEKGTIVAIKVKTIRENNDYKYVIKREKDKCCGTYSKIFKTKEEVENFIKQIKL